MVMNTIRKLWKIPKNLIFPGIVSPERMRELYALADLFLLPSYNELFPMTILEAASCEAPIMLRDLDLYKVILEGNYRATAGREEMKEAILEYQANPAVLKISKKRLRIFPESILKSICYKSGWTFMRNKPL